MYVFQPYAIWNPDFRHTRKRYPTLMGHLGKLERAFYSLVEVILKKLAIQIKTEMFYVPTVT